MNTKFSISVIEVKICPDCLAEYTGENEKCDMCLMTAEMEAFENEPFDATITENRIKAFEI